MAISPPQAKKVQLWCYTIPMATIHPRIALTCDPELDEALRRARPLLGERKPTATLARELILRGVRELVAQQGSEIDRWLDGLGATPALGSTADLLASAAALGPVDETRPYAVSEALEESREERL
jgi:hypothetical protein